MRSRSAACDWPMRRCACPCACAASCCSSCYRCCRLMCRPASLSSLSTEPCSRHRRTRAEGTACTDSEAGKARAVRWRSAAWLPSSACAAANRHPAGEDRRTSLAWACTDCTAGADTLQHQRRVADTTLVAAGATAAELTGKSSSRSNEARTEQSAGTPRCYDERDGAAHGFEQQEYRE